MTTKWIIRDEKAEIFVGPEDKALETFADLGENKGEWATFPTKGNIELVKVTVKTLAVIKNRRQ